MKALFESPGGRRCRLDPDHKHGRLNEIPLEIQSYSLIAIVSRIESISKTP
tara:strand:- start:826 stop:978 length:153 start_codon:yes stop_codon:yes gene_type:complete